MVAATALIARVRMEGLGHHDLKPPPDKALAVLALVGTLDGQTWEELQGERLWFAEGACLRIAGRADPVELGDLLDRFEEDQMDDDGEMVLVKHHGVQINQTFPDGLTLELTHVDPEADDAQRIANARHVLDVEVRGWIVPKGGSL